MSLLVALGMAGAGDGGQVIDPCIGRAAILAGVLGLFAAFIKFVLAFVGTIRMAVTGHAGQVGN